MTLSTQDLYLRCRPPQSKEELFWYCKEQLRVICEACKGAGSYFQGQEKITCPWCKGGGSHGFHIARTAVCPGHSAPLDALWDLYAGNARQQMWIATRGGGKTRAVAILEHLKSRFQRFTIQHMGAIEQQSLRCREWLRQQITGLPGIPFTISAETKEPVMMDMGEETLPELSSDAMEKVQFSNGGLIEFLPGTMAQASGPHNEMSVLDEVDEADPEVQQKFSKTPTGPRAIFLMTSTHTYATGTVSRIKRDQPLLPVKTWCVTGETRIATPEGEIPIQDLVGRKNVWVYSLDENAELTLRKAQRIKLTQKQVDTVRVRYFWGRGKSRQESSVTCTPDHKFLLLSGGWKEAQHLQPKDRLFPFYRWKELGNYPGWVVGNSRKLKQAYREHRFVAEQLQRRLVPGEVVHHKDDDHWNNSPTNLKIWTDSKHKSYHQKRFAQDPEREARRIAKLTIVRRQVGAPWMSEENRKRWAARSPEERHRIGKKIATGNLRRRENHRVLSVESAGKADVYCMQVPISELFFANGVAVHNCLFESLAKCEHDCEKAPLPDGTKGHCPLYEEEIVTADGRREIVPLCKGILARKSDGHIPLEQALLVWLSSDPYTRGVELLCRNPELGLGAGRAYWAYSPENVLPFDPVIRPDAVIEWSMDFNPGVGMEMCSIVIQQAPPEYPGEWWVMDEIVLPTSSTPATVAEFLRRYGPPSAHNNFNGGINLPPAQKKTGHPAGIWVYGDATGNARQSTTGDTDYEVVNKLLNGLPDYRCIIQSGDSNPPLIDRLNRTNELLWDAVSQRRTLKVAPRCQRLRDELGRMPLKAGSREKDKSMRIQKLGLSHLGDGLEYWVYLRFPGGVRGAIADLMTLVGRKRDTAGAFMTGGQRASGGASDFLSTGFTATAPWMIGRRDPRG